MYLDKKSKTATIFSADSVPAKILCFVGAILTCIAFFCSFSFDEAGPIYALNGWGTAQMLCLFALSLIYYLFYCKKQFSDSVFCSIPFLYPATLLFSLLLSFLYVLGKSYHVYNEWLIFFQGGDWLLLSLCMIAGYAIFINMLLLSAASLLYTHSGIKTACSRVTAFIFDKHPILMPMIIILACQIPYLIAFYPGVISWDGAFQMGETIGSFDLTWQHPPFVTFLYGFFVKLGGSIGNDNLATFVFIMLQSLLCAFAFAYVCSCLRRLAAPSWLRWGTLLYFAVLTVWPIYATTIIKDSLFYPLTTLYTCMLMLCIYDPSAFVKRKSSFPVLFITVVLMILVRHNGTYTFLLSFPFAVLLMPKKWKLAGAGLIATVLIVISCINNFLWPALGVGTKNFRLDLYSVLIQQTARYALYHSDDVTPEEYQVLSEVFEYDKLGESYNPEIIDPVKNLLRSNEGGLTYLTIDKAAYNKVWFDQFLRHPATYIQSFLNGSYGYFYPDRKEYKEGLGWYQSWQIYDNNKFMTTFVENREPARQFLENTAYALRDIPGIGMLYSCGFYTWLTMIVTLLLLVMRKWKALILCLPLLVNILVCMVSPVNAYIRYALPVYAAAPLLIGWLIYTMRTDRNVRSSLIKNN